MIILVPHKLKTLENLRSISGFDFILFSISYLISIIILLWNNLEGIELLYWMIPIVSFFVGNANLIFIIISSLIIKNKGLVNKKQLKILFYISCILAPFFIFGLAQAIFGINLYIKAYKKMEYMNNPKNEKDDVNYYMTTFTRFNLLVTTITFLTINIFAFSILIAYNALNKAVGNVELNIIPLIVFASFGLILHLIALFTSAKLFLSKKPLTKKLYYQNCVSLFLILIIFVSVPILNIFIFWHFMLLIFKNNNFDSEYSINEINPLEEYEKWELATTSHSTGVGYIQYFRGSFADDYDEDGKLILYKEKTEEEK